MHDSDFMPVEDHFARLVAGMNPEDFSLYSRAQHVRVETGFAGRQFIVYQMEGRQPKELDRIVVNDFTCRDIVRMTMGKPREPLSMASSKADQRTLPCKGRQANTG